MNIYDEIIPAKSLGGIRLKDNIKNYDWENPLFVRSNKKISGLIDTIKQGIKCIYSHEHLQQ